MEDIREHAEELLEHGKEYVNIQKEILKLEMTEKVAQHSSKIMTAMVLSLLAYLVVLMASLMLGFYIGSVVGNHWIGFAYVALGYLALLLICIIFRKYILRLPFMNVIIRNILNP